MKKERIIWLFAAGLLGLLGFSSCSPRLHQRKVPEAVDTLRIPKQDTLTKPIPGDFPPIKLMYGVPPGRYEKMSLPKNESEKTEAQ